MTYEQKIGYVKNYLQRKLEEEFLYPFRVDFEEGQFVFSMKNGRSGCRAKTRNANELIHTILSGQEAEKEALLKKLFQVLQAAVKAQDCTGLEGGSDYERVKGELILRPLSYKLVREDLKDVPHIRFGDIALVLYSVMGHVSGDYFTAKVHRSQVAAWRCSEKAVLEEALVNTSFLYPPRLYCLEDLLRWGEKTPEDGVFMGENQTVRLHSGIRGLVLTNTLEINGAIAIFYPGVAERLAEGFDSDFYIGFTSIHEAQIHPVGMVEPESVRDGVRDINRACNRKEDILSGRVYYYDREKQCFGMFVDGERKEVYWHAR